MQQYINQWRKHWWGSQ